MDKRAHVIVCGVDGSDGSKQALEWAVDEAVRRSCRLRVVTAWTGNGNEAPDAPAGRAVGTPAALADATARQGEALDEALSQARDKVDVERQLPRDNAREALCHAALDAELLVLGSHGHGMVHDRLVGSTTQRVIQHAPCPVVVVPTTARLRERRRLLRIAGRSAGRKAAAAG